MDILYISIERIKQLLSICSEELLLNVFENYTKTNKIIVSSQGQPSGLWCLDRFPKEGSVHRLNQVYVYIAFAYLGGFFQFQTGKNTFGDMNVLSELFHRNFLLQEEYDDLVHLIYESRQGTKPLHFEMYKDTKS